MESVKFDRQRGQILVQVAIMVGVLLAFVALAVDGGQVYGGRRRMQNAADAGALAGARKICFPEDIEGRTTITEEAEYYAGLNGAEDIEVDIPREGIVVVTAAQSLDTFFAGIIGIYTANVRGEAAAACGAAGGASNVWPLAFDKTVYTETIDCGQEFFVFASRGSTEDNPCTACAPYTEDQCEALDSSDPYYNCLYCGEEALGPHINTADRGWLEFPNPEDPYESPTECLPSYETSCGSPRVACWLRASYPGVLQIGDCVAGQSGVVASSEDDVDYRVGDTVGIVLWDEDYTCTDPLGFCPGTPYRVAAFGCVHVVGWEDQSDGVRIPTCGGSPAFRSAQLVRVRKICKDDPLYEENCGSAGFTVGYLPEDWEARSVSLIPWPLQFSTP